MVDPTAQDLYVFQNEHGLFKIGRSLNVAARIKSLRTTERCEIHIVETFSVCGDLEEWLHIDMDEYRVAGEWFVGTDAARQTLAELLGIDDMDWQRPYDAKGAEAWLNHIYEVRDGRSIKRAIYREITILRDNKEGNESLDVRALFGFGLALNGNTPFVTHEKVKVNGRWNGAWRQVWEDPNGEMVPVPPFTTDVATALTLWPEAIRPAVWEGTAIECCVAALTALRAASHKLLSTPNRT